MLEFPFETEVRKTGWDLNLSIERNLCGPIGKPILYTYWQTTKSWFLTGSQT